ncbi:MAG: 2-amino-4-hydroxy-6-hydroxymethyldihydropteridine diphosphokinase [Thermodesulfobacteriota bacterium]|nr:2-amino-4-hydroxy-6-hydroxymethyldihydropteridine diphosphokinase [Thermodesulfobacteriota bacterium]
MENIAFIGVGSNKGDLLQNYENAIKKISLIDKIKILKKSSLYKTEPWGYTEQKWFINGVIKISTSFMPLDLLNSLKNIEQESGKKSFKWGPRIIDLDVLFYNQEIIETPEIKIPHPFLHLRNFVIIPLCEIEPDFNHPVLKKKIKDLLNKGKDDKKVIIA